MIPRPVMLAILQRCWYLQGVKDAMGPVRDEYSRRQEGRDFRPAESWEEGKAGQGMLCELNTVVQHVLLDLHRMNTRRLRRVMDGGDADVAG